MQSEAAERSRIGRAYYAAFLESRAFVGSFLQIQRARSSGEHQAVPAALGAVAPELAKSLEQLRTMRNAADYDLDLPGIDFTSTADQACALAARIILGTDRLAVAPVGWDSISPFLLVDYLPSDPHQFDAVTFYLLSYPVLVPTLVQAISIATEMFSQTTVTIGLAYGETEDPPLDLRLASSNPDVMDYDLYRRYMTRLETEANADSGWFVVTTRIVSARQVEEAPVAHYRTSTA
ncbi:MAG: hypothetical protein WKF63_03420 [Thermomicrobiales bacterium]